MEFELQREDSADLSQAEIDQAVAAPNVELVIAQLRRCFVCGGRLEISSHELRRKDPHHYWRIRLNCKVGHKSTRLFRVDWLHDSSIGTL